MLFLIEYDRPSGQIVSFRAFDNSHTSKADDARLDLELGLRKQGIEREVVLLEAPSEDALRITHSRYFKNLSELMRAL